jgi:hypothetical protein
MEGQSGCEAKLVMTFFGKSRRSQRRPGYHYPSPFEVRVMIPDLEMLYSLPLTSRSEPWAEEVVIGCRDFDFF